MHLGSEKDTTLKSVNKNLLLLISRTGVQNTYINQRKSNLKWSVFLCQSESLFFDHESVSLVVIVTTFSFVRFINISIGFINISLLFVSLCTSCLQIPFRSNSNQCRHHVLKSTQINSNRLISTQINSTKIDSNRLK